MTIGSRISPFSSPPGGHIPLKIPGLLHVPKEPHPNGFRPKVVSIVSHGGKRRITALYEKANVGSFTHRSFMTASEYQTKYDANNAAGRKLAYLNGYNHNGSPRFTEQEP
jgi:hypothetical protein